MKEPMSLSCCEDSNHVFSDIVFFFDRINISSVNFVLITAMRRLDMQGAMSNLS